MSTSGKRAAKLLTAIKNTGRKVQATSTKTRTAYPTAHDAQIASRACPFEALDRAIARATVAIEKRTALPATQAQSVVTHAAHVVVNNCACGSKQINFAGFTRTTLQAGKQETVNLYARPTSYEIVRHSHTVAYCAVCIAQPVARLFMPLSGVTIHARAEDTEA